MTCRAAITALMLTMSSIIALGAELTGQASIIDGDTLDAARSPPTISTPSSRAVSCQSHDLDRYGRTVAACLVGDVDIGDWLVRNGFALDWPQYSKGRYGDAQRDAEHGGRGIWAGSYVEPWVYRACIRAGRRSDDCSDDASAQH